MIDNLLKTYDEQRHRFHHNETVSIIVWKLDALVDRIRELEAENRVLQERVAEYSSELVVQFSKVHDLEKRVQELERMVDIMAEDMGDSSHIDGYRRVCKGCKDADNFGIGGCGKDCLKMLYEQTAKEAGE